MKNLNKKQLKLLEELSLLKFDPIEAMMILDQDVDTLTNATRTIVAKRLNKTRIFLNSLHKSGKI